MNSSGIKRGLAATAIAALAVTGVPAIAHADTLATQNGAGVNIQSVTAGKVASSYTDGTNTTVSLVATADAAVQYVSFFYTPTAPAAGPEVRIATVTREATGEFQTEWTLPVGVSAATIRATETDAAGANPTAKTDSEAGVVLSGNTVSVEINKPAAEVGYFDQPGGVAGAYGVANNNNVMAITGTTSQSGGNIAVSGLGVNASSFAAGANPAGGTSHAFTGTVNVANSAIANNETPDKDQVLPVLETNANAQDAQGFNLYAQQIQSVTATATPVQPNSQTTDVTVTVKDQKGAPVAGALVTADNANGGAPSNAGITDGKGQVTFTGAAKGNQSYYVDTTNAAGYQVGVDYRANISIGDSRPDSITFSSADGLAYDVTEYDAGDLAITVKDAAGTALPGQTLFYKWTFTPFNPAAGETAQTSKELSVSTGANGSVSLPEPTAGDFTGAVSTLNTTGGTLTLTGYVNRDGSNPGQDSVDLALTPVSLKRGNADVFIDGPTTTTRQLETTQNFTGSVVLFDGTPLAGRTVSLSYTPAGLGNAAFSATQPAGTTRLSNTTATAVTGNDGKFAASVTDPDSTPDAAESGVLSAVGTAVVGSGANQKNGIGSAATVQGAGTPANTGYSTAADDVTVQFSADAAAKFITLTADTDSTAAENDPYEEIIGNAASPGRPVSFQINLANSSSTPLAGQQVTLKTDHGFFTPNAGAASANDPATGLTADPAPAEGGQYGEWRSLGDTITVTTDANGQATVTVAIERDAGFDDDGRVAANITATSGSATNTSPIAIDFRTDNTVEPLNAGSVEVTPADAVNTRNGIELPDARAGQVVRFNLFAKDQFGNLVADEVNISDNTLDAAVTGEGGQVNSQFANAGAALQATSQNETDQVITATWNQASNVYTDGNAATPGFQASVVTLNNTSKTDSTDAVNWYVIDFANSTFTVTTDPEGEVPVGDPIVETVTVLDQKGKPVPGLQVNFLRQGPGDQQDGDPNTPISNFTNANGQAFYAFTGTEPGTARISIVVDDGEQLKTLTDEVVIVGPNDDKQAVTAIIAGEDNGGDKDVIRFQVDDEAEGATVQLFKIKRKNGKRRLVEIRGDRDVVVPDGGELTFKIADKNGNRRTKYVAKVGGTDLTLPTTSNVQKLR